MGSRFRISLRLCFARDSFLFSVMNISYFSRIQVSKFEICFIYFRKWTYVFHGRYLRHKFRRLYHKILELYFLGRTRSLHHPKSWALPTRSQLCFHNPNQLSFAITDSSNGSPEGENLHESSALPQYSVIPLQVVCSEEWVCHSVCVLIQCPRQNLHATCSFRTWASLFCVHLRVKQ